MNELITCQPDNHALGHDFYLIRTGPSTAGAE
jgi:hypothetical protein